MDKMEPNDKIVFGPVPSRRLGASLGINNIPPKICSYSCIYCQIGKTYKMTSDRNTFYKNEDIFITHNIFPGDRENVRKRSLYKAMFMLLNMGKKKNWTI